MTRWHANRHGDGVQALVPLAHDDAVAVVGDGLDVAFDVGLDNVPFAPLRVMVIPQGID